MKILYLIDHDISTNSGITQKIKSQTDSWRRNGNTVAIISLRAKNNDYLIPQSKSLASFEKTGFLKIFSYIKAPGLIQKEIDSFEPDIIYVRFFFHRPYLTKVLNSRCKYIVELNTIDVVEMKHFGMTPYWFVLFTRRWLLGNASGYVSVTNEILSHPSFQKFRKKGCIIGNGIDTTKFEGFIRQKNDNPDTIDVVFIGTPNQKWHGLDKILYLVSECPEYKFHIIGPSLNDLKVLSEYKNQENVLIYEYLSETASKEILKNCQIGISSLALHRNNMEEASPLKSRQYLSQGLPIITGYKDPDLSDQPFVLNIGNYENNVKDNIDKIKDFISSAINIPPETIAKFAEENLDVARKEIIRLNFMERIINE